MAVGLSANNLANAWLNLLRGTAFPAKTNIYVKLHTGDPGASGTSNASAVTTRAQASFNAAASGSLSLSNTPSFLMTSTENITHVSVWDDVSAGNFLWSSPLNTSKNVVNGDTLTLTSLTLSLSPLAT